MTHTAGVLRGPTMPLPAASVVELVRRVVCERPGAVALRDRSGEWTYSWLWCRTGAIADALRETGVAPGDRVALWAGRTRDIVASALAVMSLGAAYVPIDPAYPVERVRAVLRGTAPAALVSESTPGTPRPPRTSVPTLDVTAVTTGRSTAATVGTAGHAQTPAATDLAYVIFTSGSTGSPKGVAVEHRSLVNYVCWFVSVLGTRGGGNPLFGSLGFDHTITSLWPALVSGGHLRLTDGPWDVSTLFEIRAEPYDFIKVTPSQLRFFEQVRRPAYSRLTRLLLSGGERFDTHLLREIAERLNDLPLINHYGPSEATIGCCYHRFDVSRLSNLPSVPIGRPIWNTRVYLVDERLAPASPGRPAELVVAGTGVARGYLGLDAGGEAFIDEAELGGPAGRAYRTGDQVELLTDGTMLYLGRADEQVKISGYRIELAELRRQALAVEGVADADFAVESDDGWAGNGAGGSADAGSGRIEGFVVPQPGLREPGRLAEDVRRHLMRAIPSVAVPRRIRIVAELVINAHGKRDLKATRRRGQDAG